MENNLLEVLSPILRYHGAQIQGLCQEKLMSLIIERQSDLLQVLYILRNNENTLSEITNNFLEVLSPILKYHYAPNGGYVKKTDKSPRGTEFNP